MARTCVGVGVLLAIASFVDWAGRGSVARKFGAAPSDNGQTFRGTLFALGCVPAGLFLI